MSDRSPTYNNPSAERRLQCDVLVHWRLTGRHVGTFVGVAATGRRIEFEGFDHCVIAGGKVVTNTVRYDQMEFARQFKLYRPTVRLLIAR
ncbi:ester cyclase [Rhodococcus sp. NPDC057014]|uniref:ester cyclase n=1 Tax=Rhodococcus sp. NPDC057014 TaxID=3346000 RepID=UPI003625100F